MAPAASRSSIIGKDSLKQLMAMASHNPSVDSFKDLIHSPIQEDNFGDPIEDISEHANSEESQFLTLPATEVWQDKEHKIRRLHVGEGIAGARERNIFMVGASGSGKTTLIDAMANYVKKIKWEDKKRVKLVSLTPDERKSEKEGQAHSQTKWVTVYHMPVTLDSSLSYTLNIIDTPGFGDTAGLKRDEEISKQIQYFLKNPTEHKIDCIDAICFVVKAPDARLTPVQRYTFCFILAMFGFDVKDNIFAMITFSDGAKPPVIASLDEDKVPYNNYFKFNNSALFLSADSESDDEDDEDDEEFNEMFWEVGRISLEHFFEELEKVSPKSLSLTAMVLQKREDLHKEIQMLKKKVEEGCNNKQSLIKKMSIFIKHEEEIKNNEDFEFEEDEVYKTKKKVPKGKFVTNCMNCQETCHEDCTHQDDREKYKCSVMKNGRCTKCPGRCFWQDHFTQEYILKTETRKRKSTYYEKKERYDQAQSKKDVHLQILQMIERDIVEIENEITRCVRRAKSCTAELNVTALKKDPLTDEDYVDELIFEEKRSQKVGWQDRISMLEDIKKDAKLLKDVETRDDRNFLSSAQSQRKF